MEGTSRAEREKPGWPVIRDTITDRRILIYTGTLAISKLGFWGCLAAIELLTWQLTQSPGVLGIVTTALLLPTILLAPFGGAIADRIGLLRALRLTESLRIALFVVLAVFALTGAMTVQILLVLALFVGCIAALGHSSEDAFMRVLADDRKLVAGVILQNVLKNAARFTGPLVWGIMSSHWAAEAALFLPAVCSAVFLVGLSQLDSAPTSRCNRADGRLTLVSDIGEILRYCFRHRALALLFACLVLGYFGLSPGSWAELKVLLKDESGGVKWWTDISGIHGVLTIVGSILLLVWIASRGTVAGLSRLISVSLPIGALAMLLIVMVPPPSFTVVIGLVILNFALTVIATGATVLALRAIPLSLLGRGMGVFVLVGWLGPALLASAVGALATLISTWWVIVGTAVLLFGFWLWLWPRVPSMAAALESSPTNYPG